MSQQLKLSFPTPSKIKRVNSVLSRKEKFFFYLSIVVLLGSIIAWSIRFYLSYTEKMPEYGGEYIEGVIEEPNRISPLVSSNKIDQLIARLVYSSLFTYDKEGKIVNDLAESYQIEDDGKRYKIKIKENAFWHDQEKLTAEDVAYTVQIIQDLSYHKNTDLKKKWENIEVKTEGEYTVVFQLQEPYAPFLNKLTFGILPRHIFKDISKGNFLNDPINLEPIGSGPFVYSDMEKDTEGNILSYRLLTNDKYYQKRTYLDKITFNFYDSNKAMIDAYNKKQIHGIYLFTGTMAEDWKNRKDTQVDTINLPVYISISFNQSKSFALAKKEVREALSLATNRQALVNEILKGYASVQPSPILSQFGEFSSDRKENFNLAEAEKKLEEAGWKKNNEGIREKDGQKIEFALTIPNFENLTKTGEALAKQWEKIGARININIVEIEDLQNNLIKTRDYQALMANHEYTGNDPEPSLFYHSKWKDYPGKNISLYDNEKVDKLLTDAIKETDLNKRKQQYQEFEDLILDDDPEIFLYAPFSAYILNQRIKGVEINSLVNQSFRMSDATDWFIKTTRKKKED